jgi:hypothetical protein
MKPHCLMTSRLVFVHLGTEFPNHLLANINYCKREFRNVEVVLIHDAPLKSLPNINGVSFYQFIRKDNEVIPILSKLQRNFDFRSGFWLTTKLRLLALAEYVGKVQSQVIHIESDVWLAPYFNFKYLQSSEFSLAYPRVDANRSIASIMFINGIEGARTLREVTLKNPGLSDMELLEKLRRDTSKKVISLPSSFDFNFQFAQDSSFKQEQTIFDGAAIGMHLFGADPRNTFGFLSKYMDFPSVTPKMSTLQFRIHDERLQISFEHGYSDIACLHVHSKATTLFVRDYREVFESVIKERSLGIKKSFLPRVALFCLVELSKLAILKIIRRIRVRIL